MEETTSRLLLRKEDTAISKHDMEKRRLEREAIQLFISLNNARCDDQVRLLYQRERPDAVLENTHNRGQLGVEITHLYYNECEAKRLLGRSDQEDCGPESFEQLLVELNSRIVRKETNFASVTLDYPISLLIRNASTMYGLTHFIANAELMVRSRYVFQDIWLLTRDGASEWHLYRLQEEAQIH